jgi:transposase-like protein
MLHLVYDQPDAASVHAQFDRVLDARADKLPRVAEQLKPPAPTCWPSSFPTAMRTFPDRDADMKHEFVSGAAAHAGGMLCAL